MAYIWMFTPHVFRAIIGFIVVFVKGLPKSYEIIEHIDIENVKGATLESIENNFGLGIQNYIND